MVADREDPSLARGHPPALLTAAAVTALAGMAESLAGLIAASAVGLPWKTCFSANPPRRLTPTLSAVAVVAPVGYAVPTTPATQVTLAAAAAVMVTAVAPVVHAVAETAVTRTATGAESSPSMKIPKSKGSVRLDMT